MIKRQGIRMRLSGFVGKTVGKDLRQRNSNVRRSKASRPLTVSHWAYPAVYAFYLQHRVPFTPSLREVDVAAIDVTDSSPLPYKNV
jgi:hypothetical protein